MDEAVKTGKEKGYVETLMGRRRYLPELSSANFNVRAFGERCAMNSPIQGTAADIIKLAMIAVARRIRGGKPAREADPSGTRRTDRRSAGGRSRSGEGAAEGLHGRRGRAQGSAQGGHFRREEIGVSANKPYIIGLTGGIGCGKSEAAAYLKSLGAVHVDADAISRELTVNDPEVLNLIREQFGDEVFSPGRDAQPRGAGGHRVRIRTASARAGKDSASAEFNRARGRRLNRRGRAARAWSCWTCRCCLKRAWMCYATRRGRSRRARKRSWRA